MARLSLRIRPPCRKGGGERETPKSGYIDRLSELITGPRLGHFKVNNWATFVFYKKIVFHTKHYKNRGFSRFLTAQRSKNKKGEPKICKVNNWATLPILSGPNVAQLLTLQVAQLLTLEMVTRFFFHFFAFKNVLKYLFLQCFFNINQELPKKWPKKNDNFWHFPKHRFIKKTRFVATPPFDQKMFLSKFFVLKPKTLMLNRKHNLESGKS